jgi:hypothetical protein
MQTQNIDLTLPIKIPYPVLRELLETKLIGMEIGTGERKRGQILRLGLQASPLPDYDMVLGLRIGLARKVLWAKEVPLYLHASLDFDPESGRLSVGTFKIDVDSANFVLDKALEFLANRMYYRKVLDKASVNVNELIASKMAVLNEKLQSGIPSSQGMVFNGNMENITITQIEPGPEYIVVYAHFKGGAEVTLLNLPDLDFTQ